MYDRSPHQYLKDYAATLSLICFSRPFLDPHTPLHESINVASKLFQGIDFSLNKLKCLIYFKLSLSVH